jgi:hypothetical protein
MGKIKNAVIEARELAETRETNEALLWQARESLLDAIDNPEPDEGLASAERALSLLNTYLLEVELCKQYKLTEPRIASSLIGIRSN